MSSFQFNKWAGSILAALLVIFVPRVLVHEALQAHAPEKPGFEVAVIEESHGAGGAVTEPEAPAVPIAQLLAGANVEAGQKATKPCLACHTFEKGGVNKVGPNLFGILGRGIGSHEGFTYSAAMKGKGGAWGYDEIAQFLANPKAYVAGTKMAFVGVRKPEDRANVILYLRSLADSPVPLP